ncbi:MAG: hypothetical protein JWP35_709 [Caulobacter sp.]|nr:hypothetical protein [Caulobacter sp.]
MFENATLDLPCPGCGKKHPRTVAWLKAHTEIACDCGAKIELDSANLHRGMAEAERKLKAFTKKITIKL